VTTTLYVIIFKFQFKQYFPTHLPLKIFFKS